MKHTKGPWEITYSYPDGLKGGKHLQIQAKGFGGHPLAELTTHYHQKDQILQANASLIAKAPEMYESLKKAKAFYESCFEVSGGCDHSVGICECKDREDYVKLCELLGENPTFRYSGVKP